MKRILTPSAGGPMAVNVAKALRIADEPFFLVGTDCDKYHLQLVVADEKVLVPPAKEKDRYIEKIKEIIKKYNIELVLPTLPIEIRTLAEMKDDLPVKLFLPKIEMIAIGQDKWKSYEIWRREGLPVPKTYLINSEDDLRRAFKELKTRKVWIRGSGVPGISFHESGRPFEKFEHAANWIDYNDGWGAFMASEYLGGDDLTWISLWNEGELICSQGRRRIKYSASHIWGAGAPSVSHTINREDLNQIGPKAINAIDKRPHGVMFIDFRCDEKGDPKITEINVGRFGTTSPIFYAKAGFNIVYLLVKLAYGESIKKVPRFNVLPPNLFWIRRLDCGFVLTDLEGINKCIE